MLKFEADLNPYIKQDREKHYVLWARLLSHDPFVLQSFVLEFFARKLPCSITSVLLRLQTLPSIFPFNKKFHMVYFDHVSPSPTSPRSSPLSWTPNLVLCLFLFPYLCLSLKWKKGIKTRKQTNKKISKTKMPKSHKIDPIRETVEVNKNLKRDRSWA